MIKVKVKMVLSANIMIWGMMDGIGQVVVHPVGLCLIFLSPSLTPIRIHSAMDTKCRLPLSKSNTPGTRRLHQQAATMNHMMCNCVLNEQLNYGEQWHHCENDPTLLCADRAPPATLWGFVDGRFAMFIHR
jgi:hypothetical protein